MTILTLTIISYQSQTLGPDAEYRFEGGGGTFGRSAENDWALPDPERIISGRHGMVEFRDGQYWLIDASTNGIFLKGSSSPLGKNNSVPLADGDVFGFGDYEVKVSVEGNGGAAKASPIPGDGFADSTDIFGGSVDPFAGSSAANLDPLANIGGDTASHEGARETSTVSSDSGINSPAFDPLQHLDSPSSTEDQPLNTIDDENWHQEAQENHSSAISDSFSVPASSLDSSIEGAAGGDASGIPEDWDLTGFKNMPVDIPKTPPEPATPKPPAGSETSNISQRVDTKAKAAEADITNSGAKKPAKAKKPSSQQKPSIQQKPKAKAAVPKPPRDSEGETDLFELFLLSAGLDMRYVDDLDPEEAMSQFGRLFRDIIQGMMELLRARSDLKNEFKVSQTIVHTRENNPLKFSPNASEALRSLFVGQDSGYLNATEAIQESISDLRSHQVAMIAGMEAAFAALMHRMQPDSFVDNDQELHAVKAALRAINKKSRAWDNYSKFYDDKVLKSGNAFQILFGEEFSRAYEEQNRRLKTPKPAKRR